MFWGSKKQHFGCNMTVLKTWGRGDLIYSPIPKFLHKRLFEEKIEITCCIFYD